MHKKLYNFTIKRTKNDIKLILNNIQNVSYEIKQFKFINLNAVDLQNKSDKKSHFAISFKSIHFIIIWETVLLLNSRCWFQYDVKNLRNRAIYFQLKESHILFIRLK